MSDRSDQALRERLELARKATPEGENTLWMVDGAVRGDLCIRDAFNERLLTMEDSIDRKTARHIAASSPDVVRADLEEILALRAEVARLNREADWLAEHLHRAGIPCPGDGEKFDPYGECAKKGWPCVACFREWARQETQEGE